MKKQQENSLMKQMRDLEVGGMLDVPIERILTVRSYASVFRYQEGRKYITRIHPDKKIVRVTRFL